MVRGDVEVLAAVGEPFVMLPPEEEVCCGFPLFITGQHDTLRGLVARLVSAYRERGVGTLVCSCPCCVNIMARDWPLLLGAALPFRIRHVPQHVADALASGRLRLPRGLPERLIYHDPCYLARGVGVIEEPRAVLRAIPGVRLLEFEHHGLDTRCCGAGGAARKVHHENAIAMARLTIDEAVARGADRLILNCPACYAKLHEAMKGANRIVITDLMELVGALLEREWQRRLSWSQLLARVFAIDVLECPRCASRMQRIQWATRLERIKALLKATGPPLADSAAA